MQFNLRLDGCYLLFKPKRKLNISIEEIPCLGGIRSPERKEVSWAKLGRVDSLNLEAGRLLFNKTHSSQTSWRRTLSLAFQSIGIIYGDIGTSPLYVYASTFTDGQIHNTDDIIGCLSLIIYTILAVPFIKYIFIVLWANDNGEGGTFALYSLLCRYAKLSSLPNRQAEDTQVSNYKLETPSSSLKRAQKVKSTLENSKWAPLVIFFVTIMSTSMVIGDGILTPAISVLSAVSGIKSLGENAVVGISVAILIGLFTVQRFGTDKVGSSFAPLVLVWFSFIGGIGLYNLFKYDITVLRAFNPLYIVDYFKRNGKKGWISLGGIFLCITGTEAMFADLGHFNVRAVQISFSCVTMPTLVCAYSGQGAYLRKFPDDVSDTFYKSIPDPLYWPTFVSAVAAAIIASQAMISGAFSIIRQSVSLSCFPRVKVMHKSSNYEGQVYIPEINFILMLACVIVVASFRTTENIGHAYGIAVCTVMVVTTCMVTLIMLVIWKTSIWWIALFFVVFISIEIVYLSSMLTKFTQGGFLPLLLALFLMTLMAIWHYTKTQEYMFEVNHKVSGEHLRQLVNNQATRRIPGVALLYSELVEGVPPIFSHFLANVPSIHSVVVFVTLKSIPVSRIALEERFLFRQVQPKEFRIFRCVARFGYNDLINEHSEFEQQLIEQLKEFIRHQSLSTDLGGAELSNSTDHHRRSDGKSYSNRIVPSSIPTPEDDSILAEDDPVHSSRTVKSSTSIISNPNIVLVENNNAEEEIGFVERAKEKGVVYLLGETQVMAQPQSSLLKKIVVNYVYSFLRKNFRQGQDLIGIPHSKLLKVGMTYEI
ncbi:potassium transporter 5-like [Prosopis cineraria]|uniref:potassium transporter 5-like n=1 Tax=Prosopis cineraria TaxID=364024 RepID=UPI00240EAA96|nr:potassium transporter 5-like [Prosopis cineraria]